MCVCVSAKCCFSNHFMREWNCVRSYFTHNHSVHSYIYSYYVANVCGCARAYFFFSFLMRAFRDSNSLMKFIQIWKSFDIALDQKNMWICVCLRKETATLYIRHWEWWTKSKRITNNQTNNQNTLVSPPCPPLQYNRIGFYFYFSHAYSVPE